MKLPLYLEGVVYPLEVSLDVIWWFRERSSSRRFVSALLEAMLVSIR